MPSSVDQGVLWDIWAQHRPQAAERLDVLDRAAAAESAGTLDDELRSEAGDAAQTLQATAGSCGLAAASDLAAEAERILQETGDGTRLTTVGVDLRFALQLEPAAPSAPAAVPLLLLVVRDIIRRRRLEAEARKRGMRPVVVAVPDEVPGELEGRRPDIVVVDLAANAAKRAAALALIAELGSDAPVIVLLEDEEPQDRLDVARRGGTACLTRGASAPEVLGAAALALERRAIADLGVIVLGQEPGIADLLRRHGLTVHTAETGADVWAEAPGLLLVGADVDDHLDLCRALRTDPRRADVPIVATTTHDDPDTLSRILAAGADDCLVAPVFGRELVVRIRRHLDRFRAHEARAELDTLTSAATRRTGAVALGALLRLGDRLDRPVSLVQIAVEDDHDDAALRTLGELLRRAFRDEDVVARWGGPCFVVGLFGAERQPAVDRVTSVLAEYRRHVTDGVRAAVAQYPVDGGDLETLLEAADEALAATAIGEVNGVPDVRTDGPRTTDVAI
ncbi:MAG: hypothetical protein QOF76_3076, partial [Solirubrobacteraceae bacterium]|nr:hypothetical protein [Solirubrobacteraceae bacterium]